MAVHKAHTGYEDWYTPDHILQSVKNIFTIDLDPASSIIANQTVGAKKFYTKEDDGLSKPWSGNVFINPPYTRGVMPGFAEKLLNEYNNGNIQQGIILVNAVIDTKAGQLLLNNCDAVCFIAGRLQFKRNGENTRSSNTLGQMVCYFGDNSRLFINEFDQHGCVMTRV